ncbi:helix-turn-helix domain-containing protein [Nocardia cyriacigeorgica]|uniref:helix-turn-helix domain-containing protein n=1 Tax=Nocardia cyriacigeorgica TaxID=135487 RepID=UPI0024561C96|nr:helix-turn-helix domain-containing protein [Nocardia cyriacigeorgica]
MTDDEIRAALYCASEVIRTRQQHAQPVPDWLRRHRAALTAAVEQSVTGQEASGAGSHSETAENLIGTREAAAILGCSKRQAQRLAADLDGWLVGGRWVFRRTDVDRYRQEVGTWPI